MELVFKRVPLLLAFTAELPKPGDFKAMDACGMPVLINRDKAGTVRAFLNVCAHRGAPLACRQRASAPLHRSSCAGRSQYMLWPRSGWSGKAAG